MFVISEACRVRGRWEKFSFVEGWVDAFGLMQEMSRYFLYPCACVQPALLVAKEGESKDEGYSGACARS